MAISGIGSTPSFTPIDFASLPGASGATEEAGDNFGNQLSGAIDGLQKTTTKSDDLAMQVATGDLTDIHDYMISANQTQIATQLTVAVRNKAVDAFNQIMNMQV